MLNKHAPPPAPLPLPPAATRSARGGSRRPRISAACCSSCAPASAPWSSSCTSGSTQAAAAPAPAARGAPRPMRRATLRRRRRSGGRSGSSGGAGGPRRPQTIHRTRSGRQRWHGPLCCTRMKSEGGKRGVGRSRWDGRMVPAVCLPPRVLAPPQRCADDPAIPLRARAAHRPRPSAFSLPLCLPRPPVFIPTPQALVSCMHAPHALPPPAFIASVVCLLVQQPCSRGLVPVANPALPACPIPASACCKLMKCRWRGEGSAMAAGEEVLGESGIERGSSWAMLMERNGCRRHTHTRQRRPTGRQALLAAVQALDCQPVSGLGAGGGGVCPQSVVEGGTHPAP